MLICIGRVREAAALKRESAILTFGRTIETLTMTEAARRRGLVDPRKCAVEGQIWLKRQAVGSIDKRLAQRCVRAIPAMNFRMSVR